MARAGGRGLGPSGTNPPRYVSGSDIPHSASQAATSSETPPSSARNSATSKPMPPAPMIATRPPACAPSDNTCAYVSTDGSSSPASSGTLGETPVATMISSKVDRSSAEGMTLSRRSTPVRSISTSYQSRRPRNSSLPGICAAIFNWPPILSDFSNRTTL